MKRSRFTFMVLFLGAIGMLYVWLQIDRLRIGREIEQLKEQEVTLEHRQEALQLQLSRLTAPQLIADAARLELKLEMPKPGQIVMVASEIAIATHTNRHKNTQKLALTPTPED